MNLTRTMKALLVVVITALGNLHGPAAEVLLETGFEVEQAYRIADLNGQNGWSVPVGSAEVWAQSVYSGKQSARIAPGGLIALETPATGSTLTFRSYLQASPTSAPGIPVEGQAVVLYLDVDHGLTGLDGDGQGSGTWVGSGMMIPAGTWFELAVVVDFAAKRWSCAVNGKVALHEMGFHSDALVGFRSLELAANAQDTLVDELTTSASQPSPVGSQPPLFDVPSGLGFEPAEGYVTGDLAGQNGWAVDTGQAEVWTRTVHSGVQSARIAPGGQISHGIVSGQPRATFRAFLQAAPSGPPDLPAIGQAAVLYLDPVLGLTGLDGNGRGGGTWVGSGVSFAVGKWYEVILDLDFETKTWNCQVDGKTVLSGLHFQSDQVVALGTLCAAANNGDTLLDEARFVDGQPPLPPPVPVPSPVATFPFGLGFEPAEGFFPGALDSQNGWTTDLGEAEVWTKTVYSGVQAARIEAGGRASRGFASALPLVTFQAYLQAVPSSTPDIPSTAQASVVYLDSVHGLTGLDGDGAGGGNWVGSGIAIPPGTWFELTVELDFSRRTWSCLIDGRLALSGLGFHSNHILGLGSVVVGASEGDTLLDAARVTAMDLQPLSNPSHLETRLGFEPEEGFLLGDLNGQNGWTVPDGESQVWSNAVYSGVQAARVVPGGRILQNFAMASQIVIFDGYLRASPSEAPPVPAAAQIAVLYLDSLHGITGLNGDGNGGGNWVASGVTVPPDSWFRATVRVDFTSRTWSCAVNGALALVGMGFHSDSVRTFSTFSVGAPTTGPTLLDQVSFVAESAPIPVPGIRIGITATDIEISWPADAVGYRLQVTPSLARPDWTDVETTGNRFSEKPDQASRFYRLISP